MAIICAIAANAMPVEDITLKSVSPKAGELDIELRSLSQITLTFTQDIEVGENKTATLTMPDGRTLTSPVVRNRFLANTVVLEFPDVLPLNGTYTLTVKRWTVGDEEWAENDEAGHSNPKIDVEWTVSNGLEPGVDYDLDPVSITPANEASIDYTNGGQTLSMVRIVMPQGTIMNPDAEVWLSCTESRYGQRLTFEAVAKSTTVEYTANVSPAPTVSGNYTLIIPGATFGDAEFFAEGKGHANPPVTYLYNVTGNMSEDGELLGGVLYTDVPSGLKVEKEGNGYTVTFNVAGGMKFVETKVADTNLLDEHGYAVPDVEFTLDVTEATNPRILFSATLEDRGRYTLLLPQGLYGNGVWKDSGYTDGTANPQIRHDFIPGDITNAVETIAAQENNLPNDVYTAIVAGIIPVELKGHLPRRGAEIVLHHNKELVGTPAVGRVIETEGLALEEHTVVVDQHRPVDKFQ